MKKGRSSPQIRSIFSPNVEFIGTLSHFFAYTSRRFLVVEGAEFSLGETLNLNGGMRSPLQFK